jgi:acyl-CoA dehydrogenase
MEVGSNGSIVKKYVLRKKPPGTLLASAHAVEREFLVCIFVFNLFHSYMNIIEQ